MPKITRHTVLARQTLAADIAQAFLPLETSAHETATKAAKCVAILLDGHAAAALPPTAGQEILDLLSDAARWSAMSRSAVMKAHAMFGDAAADLGIPFYSDPDCPPNDGSGKVQLQAVA